MLVADDRATQPRAAALSSRATGKAAERREPFRDPDDATLVTAIARGEAAALEDLYHRYSRPCYGLARRIVSNETLAQDVVQETFVAVWKGADRFDGSRGSVVSWLMTLVHHKAVDVVRREENLRRRRVDVEVLDSQESEDPGVHEEAWLGVRRDAVRTALADLPPSQREALTLAYFGGYTQREVAGLTGTPLGTVKTRMMAGMRRLRTTLAVPTGHDSWPAIPRPAAGSDLHHDETEPQL